MMRKSGFTLIELLIVVAIIAILAAIAVPNFLEAQARAKTSRVKSDLRTMATGLEAYHVDHGNYPYIVDLNGVEWQMPAGFPPNMSSGPGGLTTPVAYLTTALEDPFLARSSGYVPRGAEGKPLLRYERLGFGYDGNGARFNDGNRGVRGMRVPIDGRGSLLGTAPDAPNTTEPGDIPTRYLLWSVGPDRTHRVYNPDGTILVRSRFSVLNRYDPSNGTVSPGNIMRLPDGAGFP